MKKNLYLKVSGRSSFLFLNNTILQFKKIDA